MLQLIIPAMKNNASLVYNVCLIIGDFLAITLAFTVAYILRVSLNHSPVSSPVHAKTYILTFVSLLPIWILIFALLGLYNSHIYEKRFSEFGRLLIGTLIGILLVISYSYLFNTPIFPARLVVLYGFLLAFFFALLMRTAARGIRRELFGYGVGINNVLIVGDTKITQSLIDSLKDTQVTGYRIVGVIGGVKHSLKHDTAAIPLFDTFDRAIKKLGHKYQLHTIVQTELYSDVAKNNEILTYAQEHHVAYRFVPGNSELFVGNLDADLFNGIPVIVVHQTALVGWGRIVKRLTDLGLGSLLLLVASPFMLLIALIEKLSDPRSPVVFKVNRLTRFGETAKIYKFRTHKPAYNGLSPEQAFAKMGRLDLLKEYRRRGDQLPQDPRVSRLGRFLRLYSLDELPQLINVVKGDISLVGPRALDPFELEQYAKKNLILSVKTGLTGLAQISGRNDIPFEERRRLDLYYVQNWSFWNDLVILVKTISVVLFHRGAR